MFNSDTNTSWRIFQENDLCRENDLYKENDPYNKNYLYKENDLRGIVVITAIILCVYIAVRTWTINDTLGIYWCLSC